jgi:hypothetical protein
MSYIEFPSILITGDCSNTSVGQVSISVSGDTPPWIVTENPIVSGLLPTSALTLSNGTYTVENLPAGSYTLQFQDSDIPTVFKYLSFIISSGISLNLVSTNTSCGLTNGSVTGYTSNPVNFTDIYLYNSSNNVIESGTTQTLQDYVIFNNLSADTYYVVGYDYGGCSGKSESCVIQSSTGFTFGYYVVNNTSCITNDPSGKIFLTGLTTPLSSYTINWISDVNGQTGTTVTGLTQGVYQVEVTNSIGCISTEYITVDEVPPIEIVNVVVIPPTCFQPDGEVTITVNNGTPPFYFSGTSGMPGITFDSFYTFTGLSSGFFAYSVTDAGLCTVTGQMTLTTPNSFGSVDFFTTNSNCNSNNGTIQVLVDNGLGNATYTYGLSGTSGLIQSNIVGGTNQLFQNLPSGNYNITINNNQGCVFTGNTTLNSVDKFTITATTIDTVCGLNNGTIFTTVSSGATGPITYTLVGPSPSLQPFPQNVGTYNNLQSGTYQLTVTDGDGCSQIETVFIAPSQSLYFDVIQFDPVFGNDGQINVLITSGTPPFIYNWSPNVGSQTGLVITGLSVDVYTITIIDNDGCSFTRNVKLKGTELLNSFQTFTLCENVFENTQLMGKRGIKQMFNEGFYDLTTGDTNCIVNTAIFSLEAIVGSANTTSVFYSSSGITDYPSDIQFAVALENILQSFIGVGEVTIDYVNNKVTITNDCSEIQNNCRMETYNLLNDTQFIVNLKIEYNISCVECDVVVIAEDYTGFTNENSAFDIVNVLSASTINGSGTTLSNINLSYVGGNPELVLDVNGTVDKPNITYGTQTYELYYKLCDLNNYLNCDIGKVTVFVTP